MAKEKKIISGIFAPVNVGINGLGRIGKLLAWYFIANQFFREIVINLGRKSGMGLEDIVNYFIKDSTFGSLSYYLYGYNGDYIKITDCIGEREESFVINGVVVRILRETRVPELIGWDKYGVDVVVDTTGKFLDPSKSADEKSGSLFGHLVSGAKKVIVSAPFKIKDKASIMLEKTTTVIAGINDDKYDSSIHSIVSTASCTTTCLAHLLNPLWQEFGEDILSLYMVTVHAATSSQPTLDRVPAVGASDLRKTRSILNNIIPTSTGAAKALPLVIPGIKNIGFGANALRIPTNTGSLVILNLTLARNTDAGTVNEILRKAAARDANDYLIFDESQNVSVDIIGSTAACTVEAAETNVVLGKGGTVSNVVTYGWYDNEAGYMRMMAEVIKKIAKEFVA